MKQVLLLTILALTLFSCRRSNDDTDVPSIEGKWRMTEVKINSSGQRISKPSSVVGDVDITFHHTAATTGIYNGNTPTNTIIDNSFTLGENRTITISSLGMTQVMESQWGLYFVLHATSSKDYRLYDNKLAITTSTGLTLIFERI